MHLLRADADDDRAVTQEEVIVQVGVQIEVDSTAIKTTLTENEFQASMWGRIIIQKRLTVASD